MKAKTNHSPKILRGLSNVLEFGKHKGKTVEQVMKDEPNWLHWALQNIPEFKLNRNALLKLPPFKRYPNQFDEYWDDLRADMNGLGR